MPRRRMGKVSERVAKQKQYHCRYHSRLYRGSNKIEEETYLNPPTLPNFTYANYIRIPEEHHEYVCPHEYI